MTSAKILICILGLSFFVQCLRADRPVIQQLLVNDGTSFNASRDRQSGGYIQTGISSLSGQTLTHSLEMKFSLTNTKNNVKRLISEDKVGNRRSLMTTSPKENNNHKYSYSTQVPDVQPARSSKISEVIESNIDSEHTFQFYNSTAYEDELVNGDDNAFPNQTRSLLPTNQTVGIKMEAMEMLLLSISRALSTKQIIILHDNQPMTLAIINRLQDMIQYPLILLNMELITASEFNWLKSYKDSIYVHIILFEKLTLVENVIKAVTPRGYAPAYILIFSIEDEVAVTSLLALPGFSRSPYVTLLLPKKANIDVLTRYLLLTYDPFGLGKKVVKTGTFDFDHSLAFQEIFPERFTNFQGHLFHLASWDDDFPYMLEPKGDLGVRGMCITMLSEISTRLQFSFKAYHLPPDNQWGSVVDGEWKGMIGEVVRGEKDFGINQMDIIESRYSAVDFSVPFWTSNSRFLLKNPEAPPRYWSIVFPFTRMTWLAVGISQVVVTVTYVFFMQVLPFRPGEIGWTVLEVTKTILRLDNLDFSNRLSFLLLVGFWRMAASVISTVYTGNLVAYITIPPTPVRLYTLQELAASNFRPMMLDYGSYLPQALKTSFDKTLRILGEKLELLPYDEKLAFSKLDRESYAMLEEAAYLHALVVRNKVTNAYYLPEVLNPVHLGWFFPKDTPWKYKFDRYISAFTESGLTRYWYKETVRDYEKSLNYTSSEIETNNSLRPLSLEDFLGIFMLYGIGIGASALAFMTEVFRHYLETTRKKKQYGMKN